MGTGERQQGRRLTRDEDSAAAPNGGAVHEGNEHKAFKCLHVGGTQCYVLVPKAGELMEEKEQRYKISNKH
jgi:hypothetical protein